ncbi:MAG TPA: calcium-binding protein [Allosphingosinicella sp.]|jgi:Ca2+-binding RTX toxin-like protein|nr:calcium-binding protein [Allosphingosinicella sp.]
MATGTEGNDNLTNDGTQSVETINALGGDDIITVNRPQGIFTDRIIEVNGGDGFDTLIINANNYTIGGATGFDGSMRVREGSSVNWTTYWTSIERFELNNGRFFSTDIVLGDEIDIIRMSPGFGGRISTNGGNDEIYFTGTGQDKPVVADGGAGDDIVDLSGLLYFGSAPGVHEAIGGEGNDTLRGSAYRDRVDGGAGDDNISLYYVHPSIADDSVVFDTALGGAGSDNFFFGAALSQYDVVTGGADTDTLVIQGNYAGGLTLSANVTEIENLSILAGSNTAFGDPGTNLYDYVITTRDVNFAAGVQARINGAALLAGEDFTFDGSAETDAKFVVYGGKGKDTLTGGLGNDIFFYAEERFASGDTVNGGPGYDGMFLRGNYTIDFNAPGYTGLFTNIENLTLTSATDERYARGGGTEFDYNLTLSNAIVKPGETLTVSGALLMASETMILDASQESDGFLRLFGGKADDTLKGGGQADLLLGNLGADMLTGNGGADTFRFDSTADSTSGSLDRITDFTPGTDKIDLGRIDANTLVAGDQAFTWIGSNAFSGTAGELRIENLNGSGWLLLGDTDGNGFGDLRIILDLQGPTPLSGADFIL